MTVILYTEAVTMINKKLNKKRAINFAAAGLLLVSHLSFAQVIGESHSFGELKNSASEDVASKVALSEKGKLTPQTIAFKGMERTAVKIARQMQDKKLLPTSMSSQNDEYKNALHHSFSIFTGYSQLISDIDEDGYYQTFSVTFDADILSPFDSDEALVYADLYLSQNGGPWVLYFSTDNFLITGEDTEDEFEVITQLDSGYDPDHYDVLIDLYEVGYDEVVATYSSNDSNALYALPLESRDYDPEYVEVEIHEEHSGEGSWVLLSGLLALFLRRG